MERTYKALFNGRSKGAIGSLHTIYTTVKAKNLEEARLKLYERYEHITNLKLSFYGGGE